MFKRVLLSTGEILPDGFTNPEGEPSVNDTFPVNSERRLGVVFIADDRVTQVTLPTGATLVYDAKRPDALTAPDSVLSATFGSVPDYNVAYVAVLNSDTDAARAAIAGQTTPVKLSGQFSWTLPGNPTPFRSARFDQYLDPVIRQPGAPVAWPAVQAIITADPATGTPGQKLVRAAPDGQYVGQWVEDTGGGSAITSVNGQTSGAVTITAAGLGAELAANKGAGNGYAPLDSSSKVPAAYLPSYVDDVLEFANLAALPATGETGKIYVTLDTNREYRWSGSTYIQLVASPGTTDALAEGAANFYFTNIRARAAVAGAAMGLVFSDGTTLSSATGPQVAGALAGQAIAPAAITTPYVANAANQSTVAGVIFESDGNGPKLRVTQSIWTFANGYGIQAYFTDGVAIGAYALPGAGSLAVQNNLSLGGNLNASGTISGKRACRSISADATAIISQSGSTPPDEVFLVDSTAGPVNISVPPTGLATGQARRFAVYDVGGAAGTNSISFNLTDAANAPGVNTNNGGWEYTLMCPATGYFHLSWIPVSVD